MYKIFCSHSNSFHLFFFFPKAISTTAGAGIPCSSVRGRRQSTSLAPLTNKYAALGLEREEHMDNDSLPERDVRMVQLRTWFCQKKLKVLKKRWRLLVNGDAERHWGPHLPHYFWILLFIMRENLIMAWGETVFSCVMVDVKQNTDASKILLFCFVLRCNTRMLALPIKGCLWPSHSHKPLLVGEYEVQHNSSPHCPPKLSSIHSWFAYASNR